MGTHKMIAELDGQIVEIERRLRGGERRPPNCRREHPTRSCLCMECFVALLFRKAQAVEALQKSGGAPILNS